MFDTRLHTKQLSQHKLHEEIITALDVRGNDIITASPDSTIKVTNIQEEGTNLGDSGRDSTPDKETSSPSCPEKETASLPRYTAETTHSIALKCKGASKVKVRHDGKLFAAAGWDGGLRLYGCKKYNLLALTPAHDPESISDMILYDNHIVCSGRDRKISFWTFY